MYLDFKKIQATGNDYIYVTDFFNRISNKSNLAARLSDRHFGIGGDGVVFLEKSSVADGKMVMFNADGTEGNMCGNAIRAVAKILSDKGISKGNLAVIETKSGVKTVEILGRNPFVAKVKMGKASFLGEDLPVNYVGSCLEIPFIKGGRRRVFSAVSVGNYHAVTVVNSSDAADLDKTKKAILASGFFTDDVNVEVCEILSKNQVKVRVLERGSGETLACGTGATAVVAALSKRRLIDDVRVEVLLKGGKLVVEKEGDEFYLTGEVEEVFSGCLSLEGDYDKR